jgi:hypothetical protein
MPFELFTFSVWCILPYSRNRARGMPIRGETAETVYLLICKGFLGSLACTFEEGKLQVLAFRVST